MFNPSPFPSRLHFSLLLIGARCPNAMAFWKCEANSRPLTFRNFCHVLFERGWGDQAGRTINMDATSSNVAFFLRVFACLCVRGGGGTLCVQSLTFLPAHPQIWVSNPQSESIFWRRSRTKLLLLLRCRASHLSCVPLSGAPLLYLACCHGSTSVT